jgi:hypothetical protein
MSDMLNAHAMKDQSRSDAPLRICQMHNSIRIQTRYRQWYKSTCAHAPFIAKGISVLLCRRVELSFQVDRPNRIDLLEYNFVFSNTTADSHKRHTGDNSQCHHSRRSMANTSEQPDWGSLPAQRHTVEAAASRPHRRLQAVRPLALL